MCHVIEHVFQYHVGKNAENCSFSLYNHPEIYKYVITVLMEEARVMRNIPRRVDPFPCKSNYDIQVYDEVLRYSYIQHTVMKAYCSSCQISGDEL